MLDPPADASSINRNLIAILSDIEDSIETEYVFLNIDLLEQTITFKNSRFQFLGQDFTCATGIDCEGLLALNNTGGQVTMIFIYMGNSKIQLVFLSTLPSDH